MHDVEHNQLFVCAVFLLPDNGFSFNADALVKQTSGESFARENNSARTYICKVVNLGVYIYILSLIHI